MRDGEYYYMEINCDYLRRVMEALAKRIQNGSAELTLKNGTELLVGGTTTGDIRVYDDEPNLIAEFDNDGFSKLDREWGGALFNAAVFLIREARKPC